MTRSERYQRALSMTNRIYELIQRHKWTTNESSIALRLMDEPVPMVLHAVGGRVNSGSASIRCLH